MSDDLAVPRGTPIPALSGYRRLNEDELALIDDIKSVGNLVAILVSRVGAYQPGDARWVAIGETHLQQGFMALVRSVAKPTGF